MKFTGQPGTGGGGVLPPPFWPVPAVPQPVASAWAAAGQQVSMASAEGLLAKMTGDEPDEKLREALVNLVPLARHAPHQPHCPVRILDALSHESLKRLVAGMPRAALLFLFAEERKCRAAARPGISPPA